MDADSLIRAFYSSLSRDLLVYMVTVAVAASIAWYGVRIKGRRGWLAAALVLTIVGGGLFTAAYSYRAGIPAKLEADLAAAQANLDSARQAFIDRYGADRSVPHFRRLAIVWGIVGGAAIAAMLTYRRPAVLGICTAILLLCAASFVLDLTAFMRDLVYAARWIELE